jgi:hypothetical protein
MKLERLKMSNTLLKARGCLWRDLSNAEKQEIISQIKNIERDPNYTYYKYYKSPYHKWIILNANTIPMKLNRSVWN